MTLPSPASAPSPAPMSPEPEAPKPVNPEPVHDSTDPEKGQVPAPVPGKSEHPKI